MGKHFIPHVAATHYEVQQTKYMGFSVMFCMPNGRKKVYIKTDKSTDPSKHWMKCSFSLKKAPGFSEMVLESLPVTNGDHYAHGFIPYKIDDGSDTSEIEIDFIIESIDIKSTNKIFSENTEEIKLHNGKIHYPDN